MSLLAVGLLAVVESLVGRLLLVGCMQLMTEHCFVGGAVVFDYRVEKMICLVVVFVVVDP